MGHFWEKLGLGRDKSKERMLHDGTEPDSKFMAAATYFGKDSKPLAQGAPRGELRDLPVVDILKWDVSGIRGAVAGHVNGTFGSAGLLVDAMMADDRIQGATNGRNKGITKRNVILTPSFKAKDQAKAKEIALDIENDWSELLPESLLEDIIKWFVYTGFCLLEIVWELKDERYVPRLKVWHPLYIYYRIDIRKYIVFTVDGQLEIEPNDPKWALFTPYGAYRGWMRGAVRSVSIPWIVRQFALRDWARYSEVHGLPQKKAKVPAQAPTEDKRRFFNSVKRLGSESAFLLPVPMGGGGEWDVELLEAKDSSWKSFDGLIERCDKSITLTVRGTNLTTSVQTGTGAATDAHRDEDSDYADSDCRKLSEFMYKQILMPYCLYNYGDASLAPVPSFDAEPVEDKKADIEVWNGTATAMAAFKALGWELDNKAVADKFGIPLVKVVEVETPAVDENGDPIVDVDGEPKGEEEPADEEEDLPEE